MIEEQLQKNNILVSEANGNSMLPLLRDGDKVVIAKVFDIKKYDVVLFKKESHYILHRVIKIDNNKLIIRGDNNVATEVIEKKDVIGKLVGYYNENGYVEINDKLNRKYYYRSLPKYILRKIVWTKHKTILLLF